MNLKFTTGVGKISRWVWGPILYPSSLRLAPFAEFSWGTSIPSHALAHAWAQNPPLGSLSLT